MIYGYTKTNHKLTDEHMINKFFPVPLINNSKYINNVKKCIANSVLLYQYIRPVKSESYSHRLLRLHKNLKRSTTK